jgi:hypothetical protein
LTIDWDGVVSDPKILAVVEKVIAKKIENIRPTVTSEGRIFYAEISDIAGDDPGRILEALTRFGVLGKVSEARLLACPVHEDVLDLMPRLRCAACNSMLMKKGTLYQHICGNIAPIETYGGTCPKCGKPSPEQSLKLMGVWYECQDCKTKSAAPNVYLYCRKFNHDFPVAQAKLVDQASFKLTEEGALDLKLRLGPIIGIFEGLRAKKVQAKLSGQIPGASGVLHSFDLVLEKSGKLIPVDVRVSQNGEVQVVAVLATYAKALDINAKPSVMVAMPAASADSKRTASAYGMILVEGSNTDSVVENLLSSLGLAELGDGKIKADYLKARNH